MKAKITKIQELTMSKNQDVAYKRLHFQLEDGSHAMTDIVPKYRNYSWWKPVIEAGVGTWIDNVSLMNPGKVNADSRINIIQAPLPTGQQQIL